MMEEKQLEIMNLNGAIKDLEQEVINNEEKLNNQKEKLNILSSKIFYSFTLIQKHIN